MAIPYTLTDRSLTLVVNNTPHSIPRSHRNWDKLLAAINDNLPEEDVLPLLDIAGAIAIFMDGAIQIKDRSLSLDGKPLDTHLTRRILQHMDSGLPGLAQPLMALLLKTKENPSYRAVQGLYEWLEKSNLPITEDGEIIAYKIVGEDYLDIHSKSFDHGVGNVVSQPRNECDEDPDRTCSYGLHFCSAEYLPYYGTAPGNRVVIVKIHPRDVVAFPKDYNTAKGRCCRLEVIGEVDRSVAADIFGANLVFAKEVLAPGEPEQEFWEGQIWKTRGGAVVRLLTTTLGVPCPIEASNDCTYYPDGNVFESQEDDDDLVELLGDISEWDIDPTRPVTNKYSDTSELEHIDGSIFNVTFHSVTESYDFNNETRGWLKNL